MSDRTVAIAKPAAGAMAVRAARPLILAEFIDQEAEQRRLIGEYIRGQMKEGTDFGALPGTETKVLLKPGAEKLVTLFRCSPEYVIEDKIEDWASNHFYYRFTARIMTLADGVTVAEGVGSCSSYESRYKWRQADRTCPNCGLATIKKSKYPPRNEPTAAPGWYCFAKVGGCGQEFYDNDPQITSQPVGRVVNPDLADVANTVLKMAKKRALVDAALALARCSDIFTQDLDDDEIPAASGAPAGGAGKNAGADRMTPHRQAGKPAATAKAGTPNPEPAKTDDTVEGEILPAGGGITDGTREKVLQCLHALGGSWRNEKIRKRVAEIVGREIPAGTSVAILTEAEGVKVHEVMAKALEDANAKKAAKAAKAEEAAAKAKADAEAAELAARLGGTREPGDDDLTGDGDDFEGGPDEGDNPAKPGER